MNKWTELLAKALMLDRHESEQAHIDILSAKIARAIPGDTYSANDTFLMLYENLRDSKNQELRRRVVSGSIEVSTLVTMEEEDLVNPQRQAEVDAERAERSKDINLAEIAKSKRVSSMMFKCSKCGQRDVDYYEMQTRSADEPMTVFITCNSCGNKWRR